jgi:hypothetical protein
LTIIPFGDIILTSIVNGNFNNVLKLLDRGALRRAIEGAFCAEKYYKFCVL